MRRRHPPLGPDSLGEDILEIQSSHHIPGGSPTSARLAWAACLHDEVTNNGADSHIGRRTSRQYVEIRNVVVTSVSARTPRRTTG